MFPDSSLAVLRHSVRPPSDWAIVSSALILLQHGRRRRAQSAEEDARVRTDPTVHELDVAPPKRVRRQGPKPWQVQQLRGNNGAIPQDLRRVAV